MSLNETQLFKVLDLGYNAMQRIHAVTMMGHVTLGGHCVYVHPSQDDIIGHLFLGLNGNQNSYDRIVKYCQDETMDVYRAMTSQHPWGGQRGTQAT